MKQHICTQCWKNKSYWMQFNGPWGAFFLRWSWGMWVSQFSSQTMLPCRGAEHVLLLRWWWRMRGLWAGDRREGLWPLHPQWLPGPVGCHRGGLPWAEALLLRWGGCWIPCCAKGRTSPLKMSYLKRKGVECFWRLAQSFFSLEKCLNMVLV